MADDKRVTALQDEIKLLKGELKNSLSSVREYLLNMELPSSEFSTILAALGGEGNGAQKITLDGSVGNKPAEPEAPASEIEEETEQEVSDRLQQPPEDEDLIDVEGPEEELSEEMVDENPEGGEELNPEDNTLSDEEEDLNPEDELSPEEGLEEGEDAEAADADNEEMTPESEIPAEEEGHMALDQSAADANRDIPKVNMLANLINWTARAKKEIGYEQLPTFLDVYGISGHLTPELKEVIIHLAEVTKERPDGTTDADIWSQSMLSLHGILTGGDAPLNPVLPFWKETTEEEEPAAEEEIIEIDKNKDKPVKLKLVFPDGKGKNKEFCIDLTPDEDKGTS